MSSVGDNDFDICRGLPQLLKPRVDVWTVLGLDGVGAQTLGQGDATFTLRTIAYCLPVVGPDAATADQVAQTLINACNALQGTITTVEDDWGNSYSNILVQHVEAGPKIPCRYQNAAAVRVELQWNMVTT